MDQLFTLEKLLSLSVIHIYWLDRNNVYQGCNEKQALSAGLSSRFDIVGKRNCDLPWNKNKPEVTAFLDNINLEVMLTGVPRIVEEQATLIDGAEVTFISHKIPLTDNGEVVGLLGLSVDITSQKLQEALLKYEKKEALFTLDYILAHMPVHVYWKDKNGVYLGGNDRQAKSLGLNYGHELVGKTDFDLPGDKSSALRFRNNDLEVMSSGNMKTVEEEAIFDNKKAVVLSKKVSLRNSHGEVTGVLGVSVDLTEHKETEKLQLEMELQKNKLQEQTSFNKIAAQVAHDIRSPLASLSMVIKTHEKDIPEQARIVLREISANINDIANNLLHKHKKESGVAESPQLVLISLMLLQVLSEKKLQYKNSPIKFKHAFCLKSNFTFIKVEPTSFKRMMSNLINNAVEALEGKNGKIILRLEAEGKNIKITIEDNGKGMPQEVTDKIMNNVAITVGKKDGRGIGFTQVRDTLKHNQGKLEINSKVDIGTKIAITLPITETPEWAAREIKLDRGDIVVILDDDSSIHHAWKLCFGNYNEDIKLKCFTQGKETINFINTFPEKDKIFLLADFELLGQGLNGTHIIERTNIKRSILVTSHYNSSIVRDLAIKNTVQILPKPLVSEVSIAINIADENNK